MLEKALKLLLKTFVQEVERLRSTPYRTQTQRVSYAKNLEALLVAFIADYKDLLQPELETRYKKALNKAVSGAAQARGGDVQRQSFRKTTVPPLDLTEFWTRFETRVRTMKNIELEYKRREAGIQAILKNTDLEALEENAA